MTMLRNSIDDTEVLATIEEMITSLRATTSRKGKADVIRLAGSRCPRLRDALCLVLNPFLTFGVTSETILAFKDRYNVKALAEKPLFGDHGLLRALVARHETGHAALAHCRKFFNAYPLFQQALTAVFDKDLKCGAAEAMINQVFPGTVPVFDVALGCGFDDAVKGKDRWPKKGDAWFMSRKLDGVRCLAMVPKAGPITLLSRSGREITCADAVKAELEQYQGQGDDNGFVLDGELSVATADGSDDFKAIVGEVRKKVGHQIKNPHLNVFDMILMTDFVTNGAAAEQKLSDRLWCLRDMLGYDNDYRRELDTKDNHVVVAVRQWQVESRHDVDRGMVIATSNDWEGLILRRDTPYRGGRSKDILKVKRFQDIDLRVEDVVTGAFTVTEGGAVHTETVVTHVVVGFKGAHVGVGSGFTLAERRCWRDRPNEINGAVITVRYFEETTDKKGKPSLRFPTFVTLHGKERKL